MYGILEKQDHEKTRMALLVLTRNDTQVISCPPALDKPIVFSCPVSVIKSFHHQPATNRLVNYDSTTATNAAR
jgi:hypothetical protein